MSNKPISHELQIDAYILIWAIIGDAHVQRRRMGLVPILRKLGECLQSNTDVLLWNRVLLDGILVVLT